MTNSNDLRDMIALAEEFDDIEVDSDGKCKWTDVANAQAHLRAQLIGASASRADFDAGRVAGQRDMQERCKAVADGEIEQCTSHFGRVMAKRISGSIASLPLSGKESDGGEPDAERTQRRLAVSDEGLGAMQAVPREPHCGPSDPSPDSASADRLRALIVADDSEDLDDECELCGGRGTVDAYTDRDEEGNGRDEIGCPSCIERAHSRVVRAALAAPAGEVAWLRAAPEGDTVAFVTCDENDDGAFAVYGRPPAPVAEERDRISLGDIVRMNENSPYFHEWRDTVMKVVGLHLAPDGGLWASVIEGNPRHRGNGQYDSETTDIDALHLSRVKGGAV